MKRMRSPERACPDCVDIKRHRNDGAKTHEEAKSRARRNCPDVLHSILSFMDPATRDPALLTTLACVCPAWRDAAYHDMYSQTWQSAAHLLLPFTQLEVVPEGLKEGWKKEKALSSAAAVKAILHRVGGYRRLVVQYRSAIARRPPPLPDSSKRPPVLAAGWFEQEWHVIFEVHDRVKGEVVLSVGGRGHMPPWPSQYELKKRPEDCEPHYPCILPSYTEKAAYVTPFFKPRSMCMPWEQACHRLADIFARPGRFVARVLLVTGKGTVSLLYASDLDGGLTCVEGPLCMPLDFSAYEFPRSPLPHAVEMGLQGVRGSVMFVVEEEEERDGDCDTGRPREWRFIGNMVCLNLHTEPDKQPHALADVLYHALK